MNIGTRLRDIADRTTAIEAAVDDVIMCHEWLLEIPLKRPATELRTQLSEAIERLKLARA